MSKIRLCDVCGKPGGSCNTPHTPGAGLTINRINPEESKPIMRIQVSKERLYFNADKTKIVREGDPEAAFLFVGKGGEIHPDIAEKFGIETADAQAVAVVPRDLSAERSAMISPGTSAETIANYDKMIAQREANEALGVGQRTVSPSVGVGRQAALAAEGLVNQRLTGTTSDDTPGVVRTADSTGGKSGSPVNAEAGETGATLDGETTGTETGGGKGKGGRTKTVTDKAPGDTGAKTGGDPGAKTGETGGETGAGNSETDGAGETGANSGETAGAGDNKPPQA